MGQTKEVRVFVFRMEGFGENTRTLDGHIRGIQRRKRVAAKHIEEDEATNLVCPVCMGEINKNDLTELDCGHKYHSGCLERWLHRSSTCPTCRKIV